MLEIIIPTLGRIDKQKTLSNIPEKYKSLVTLVVQEHEYEDMKVKYPDIKVWQLPSGTKGIAKTRKEIAYHWKGKRIWVMDDDLQFVKLDEQLKGHPPTSEDFYNCLIQIESWMNDGYIHGGLQTHNTPPSEKAWNFNTRVYTNVFYSERLVPEDIDWGEEYELMPEDFYVNLQLLTTGHQNVVFQHFRVRTSDTQSKGGCESFRTLENHNRGQEILAAKFPRFVEVYEKEVTSGPWEGKKKNALKIQWKKAYESSQYNTLESFF